MNKSLYFMAHIFTFLLSWRFFCIVNGEEIENRVATAELKVSGNATLIKVEEYNSEEEYGKDGETGNTADEDLKSSIEIENSVHKEMFSEAALQNSVNEVINNDTPVIVPLSDVVTTELEQKANISVILTDKDEENVRKPSTGVQLNISQEAGANIEKTSISEANISSQIVERIVVEVPIVTTNLTEAKNEEIPSFSEWAQKRLEEAEKNQQVNSSTQSQNVSVKPYSSGKLRWKNYASLDCGAKVVLSNPEAVSPSAILSPSMDEYKLNTCTSRIWFIVELCEAIQVTRIDIANYELFSSSPKDFTVSVSDRFPTRDWQFVGHFTAKDERDVQSFDLEPQIFGKFIKVEIKSHHGSEHYCPISLFRAYGTSVFEVLQKEDPANINRAEDENDDDDDDDEALHQTQSSNGSKNIFSSATDAVINIVKKAAEVLGNKVNNTSNLLNNGSERNKQLEKVCTTPSHYIICNNCSDTLFNQLYEIISCQNLHIENLVNVQFIRESLLNSKACHAFGGVFKGKSEKTFFPKYIEVLFPIKYIGALCNSLAIIFGNTDLNITQQYSNTTETLSSELVQIKSAESQKIKEILPIELPKENSDEEFMKPTDPLLLGETESDSIKSSCSTDISYISQIQPTKTLTSNLDIDELNTDSTGLIKETSKTETLNVSSEDVKTEDRKEINIIENLDSNIDVQQEIESVTESIEAIEENLENFISDFTQSDGNQNSMGSSQSSATAHQSQKESVFLRLSNRIKMLERNMSLSSQYLEELSKRYKRQVEEMQRLFENTILVLKEESNAKDKQNKFLEEHLANLTTMVESLMSERNNTNSLLYLLFLCGCLFVFVSFFCRKWASSKFTSPNPEQPIEIRRRKSIDIVSHSTPKKRKRRPSDQALKIVASSTVIEKNGNHTREKQKKRRKKVSLIRSNSIVTLSEDSSPQKHPSAEPNKDVTYNKDWVEDIHHGIEDIPFALDESEHSTLEALPLANDISKIDFPNYITTATDSRLDRYRNGSSLSGIAKKFNLVEKKDKRQFSNMSSNGSVSSWTDTDQSTAKEKGRFRKFFSKLKSQRT